MVIYEYNPCQSSVTHTGSIKDLGVFQDSKLHFNYHGNYIFSRCIKLLGPVRSSTFSYHPSNICI
jgi:hypothetical protein